MPNKIEFEVTEKAGLFVAGRRSPGKGQKMLLTETEAYHAVQLGELAHPGQNRPRKQRGEPSAPAEGAGESTVA